jgi:acyl carrier protein
MTREIDKLFSMSGGDNRSDTPMNGSTLETRITDILLEYAQRAPEMRPLDAALSLHDDLEIESLQLVSVALRLGDELEVDLIEQGVELANLKTVGDLVSLGRSLQMR